MTELKTFRLDVRVRNNQIVARREAMGFPTAAALARAMGDPKIPGRFYDAIIAFESFRKNPMNEYQGRWNKAATRLAAFLGVNPEVLWPTEALAFKNANVTLFASARADGVLGGMLHALPPPRPDDACEAKEELDLVESALKNLDPRRRDVVRRHYGLDGEPESDMEISKTIGVSRQRVVQLREEGVLWLRDATSTRLHLAREYGKGAGARYTKSQRDARIKTQQRRIERRTVAQ